MKLYFKNIFRNFIIRNFHNENKGFSLIELIFVITILSLISSISLPSLNNLIKNYQKNSYTDELVSFIELVKREARRYGMSCSIKIDDNFNYKNKEKEGFIIECSGSNDYTKKIYSMVPKLNQDLIQRVSNEINITPKGQIFKPNNKTQGNILILVDLLNKAKRNQLKPKCILINVPSGVISVGKYNIDDSYFDYSIKNKYLSNLKETFCLTDLNL